MVVWATKIAYVRDKENKSRKLEGIDMAYLTPKKQQSSR